jgi:hypothetical protein
VGESVEDEKKAGRDVKLRGVMRESSGIGVGGIVVLVEALE